MAINEIVIDSCRPAEVFAFLADGQRYADWVVGAQNIRSVDPTWPQVGSKLNHTLGLGPLKLKDSTSVVEMEVGKRLVLEARFRPIGRARVEFRLEPDGDAATRLHISENVINAPPWIRRLADPSIHARNAGSLHRLREILESQPTE